MSEETLHISSLLLRSDPDQMPKVLEEIKKLQGAEIPVADKSGKIIVTLETPSESEIVEAMTTLQLIDGVVSAALIFHQAESAEG